MADPHGTPARFRRPWYWLFVLILSALAASALCVWNARERVAQNRHQFETAQMLRISQVKTNIDDLFGDAEQLVSSGALIYSRMPPQPALAARITREMYASALNKRIYGTGAFFVRGAFRSPGPLMSFYVRRYDARAPRDSNVVPFAGGVQVDYASAHPRAADDYTRQAWFREALRAPGRTIVEGPYGVGRTFITVERRFDRDGRAGGVYAVDVLAQDFEALMRKPLVPGDVAAIVSRAGTVTLDTAPLSGAAARMLVTAPMRFTPHSHIVLASNLAPLQRANASIWLGTTGLLAAIWLIAGLIAAGLLQRWRAREREDRLQTDQARLEREIAISHRVQAELHKAAYTDLLTGLPNSLAFRERAAELLAGNADGYAVILIDLDHFKIVNETLGHLSGDKLLRTIGERLRAVITDNDLLVRAGGDEFLIMGPGTDRVMPLEEIGMALLSHIGQPMVINGRTLYPEASVGIVLVDRSYTSADEILRDVDIAVYEAKRRGRGRFVFFDAEMRRRVAGDSELENALRRALERDEIVPYYQPVVDVRTGTIEGFEALARWQRGADVVSACDFMPFAESHGLVAAIDVRMLQEVYRQCRAIYDVFPGSKIAVNISASELATPGLVETVLGLGERNSRPGDRIELEITETTMMSSSETAQRTIEELKKAGIGFVLDDFGTGYSSLAYLQRLPISAIKIDRAFVAPLPYDRKAAEIVRSIVMLARSFGLSTTAEGVESREQFECLRDLGIDCAQGFFFSPAMDISALVQLPARTFPLRSAVE